MTLPSNKISRMIDSEFWGIVDESRKYGPDEHDVYMFMRGILADWCPDRILAYGMTENYYGWSACTNRVRSGFYILMGGGFSDDLFLCFVIWLVYQGREFYEGVCNDPNYLMDVNTDFMWERMLTAVADAYKEVAGEDYFDALSAKCDSLYVGANAETPFDPSPLPTLYPALWAKFVGANSRGISDLRPGDA